jgi:hypothetical protein
MTLTEPDYPRRIDRVVDYVGDSHHEASTDPRTERLAALDAYLTEARAV